MTPDQIYPQSIDKQRVVITGNGSHFISRLVAHVFKQYNRKIDYVLESQSPVITKEAPTIIIQTISPLLIYKHHIGILSELTGGVDVKPFEQFADATPKGGTLIYSENDPKVKAIGSKARADIQAIPYKLYKHEVKAGKTYLISSTSEKIPFLYSSELELQYVSAAKEVLKKLGITSGQFYTSVSNFELK